MHGELKNDEVVFVKADALVASAKAGSGILLPASDKLQFEQHVKAIIELVEQMVSSNMERALEVQKHQFEICLGHGCRAGFREQEPRWLAWLT